MEMSLEEVREQLLDVLDAVDNMESNTNIFDPVNADISEILTNLLNSPAFKNLKLVELVEYSILDRSEFYTFLTKHNVIRRDYDSGCFFANSYHISKGYFFVEEKVYPDGKRRWITMATPKGVQWLKRKFPEIFRKEIL